MRNYSGAKLLMIVMFLIFVGWSVALIFIDGWFRFHEHAALLAWGGMLGAMMAQIKHA